MSAGQRTRGPASVDEPSEPDEGSASPILELLAAFLLVFVAQTLTALVGAAAGLFVLAAPLETNPWTIVTSVYAHLNLGHLLSNAAALVVFGWPVARATTRLRFHAFFLVTGALAGISQVLVTDALTTGPVRVLGASGAVFALLGYLIASNRLSASLASFVDVPRWLTLAVFLGLAAAVTLATAGEGVALVAHFTGLLLGLLAGRARVLHVGR